MTSAESFLSLEMSNFVSAGGASGAGPSIYNCFQKPVFVILGKLKVIFTPCSVIFGQVF